MPIDQAARHCGVSVGMLSKLENGKGVKQSSVLAAHWYAKAANQGHKNAQFNLGLAYTKGDGVEKDLAQAANWFAKVAAQGDKEAQYAVGVSFDCAAPASSSSLASIVSSLWR